MGETKKIFISYSHKDRDTCNKIDSFLAKTMALTSGSTEV